VRPATVSTWNEEKTWDEQASDVDPYVVIRQAMAAQRADLPVNEITVIFGGGSRKFRKDGSKLS
jgi:hypothetical protein